MTTTADTSEFKVGDRVAVMDVNRRPSPVVRGYGTITRITDSGIYFVSGFPCGRAAWELRKCDN